MAALAAAVAVPRVVRIDIDNFTNIQQKIQFKLYDGTAKDILWDHEHERIIILDAHNFVFTVDCEGTGVVPRELTPKEILEIMGFKLREYMIEDIRCLDIDDVFENLLDTPLMEQVGCNFTLIDLY